MCVWALSRSVVSTWDPIDCSPPGSSVHGILQTKILEGVAISCSRGSFQLRNQTWVSCISGRLFTDWAMMETLNAMDLFNLLFSVLSFQKEFSLYRFLKIYIIFVQKLAIEVGIREYLQTKVEKTFICIYIIFTRRKITYIISRNFKVHVNINQGYLLSD